MADPITPQVSDRICQHMNKDHGDAIALYAKVYGNAQHTESATMDSIDPQGMNISAQVEGEIVPIRVEFDHTLQDATDAHHTLVAMIKQAKSG